MKVIATVKYLGFVPSRKNVICEFILHIQINMQ